MDENARNWAECLTDAEAADILGLLEKKEDLTIGDNEQGMVMLTARDPFGCDFYVGEVLVTEAEAEYGASKGYGMVMGNKAGQARVLAVYDVALRSGDNELIKMISEKMKTARERFEERISIERSMTASTKVDFGLMAEG